MVDRIALETSRLRLRSWHDDDLEPLAQLCADPEVMRYDPALLSRDECAALMVRSRLHLLRHGFGLWALERGQWCLYRLLRAGLGAVVGAGLGGGAALGRGL